MLANALIDIFHVEIIVLSQKEIIAYPLNKKVVIRFFAKKGQMAAFLAENAADILISTTPSLHKYIGNWVKRCDVIAWDNQNYYSKFNEWRLLNSIKKIPKLVLANADLTARFQKIYSRKEIIYIPNALEYIPENRVSNDTLNILAVGKLVREKGIRDLIDVMEILLQKQSDVVLNIIGDGPLKRQLTNAIKEKHLEKNITIYSYISEDEYHKLLRTSSIFLIGSQDDIFSISLLEAMSYGLPCVAFSDQEQTDIIKNELNGYLIPNRNKALMAKKIEKLLNDRTLLDELGSCARETIMNYDIKIIKGEWLKNI